MNERAIEEIKSRFREILEPAKKKNTYICEICKNGTGKTGDGLAVGTINPFHLTCFKCGFQGDIIEYYKQLNNVDFKTALNELSDTLNISLENKDTHRRSTRANSKPVSVRTSNYPMKKEKDIKATTESEEATADYSEFFRKCNESLNIAGNSGLEYMQNRGISLEICNKHNIGYCEKWNPPTVQNAPETARIIIPNNAGGYLARAIDSTQKDYQKQKAGRQNIFNYAAINSDQSRIFIVEGEIDAMSIEEAGQTAIGLGSTNNVNLLLELIDAEPKAHSKLYILCKDNDEAGNKAEIKLIKWLDERHIRYITADINGKYKDANEHLQNDRKAFIESVQQAVSKSTSDPFESDLMSNNIDKILETFGKEDNKALSTGFKKLDEAINGGISKGELTLIGAAPSLGKTTLAMQIIENIAQQTNEEILIFSLEMSKAQHFSKSISRLSWETNSNISDSTQDYFLLQASEVMNGSASVIGKGEPFKRALTQYRTYADRIHIFDSNRNINYVTETAERFILSTGKKPIIVIDYVQLLKTNDSKASAMDVIQETIGALNSLKAKYNLAIIAIVAFNRESNRDGKKASLESGRDTSDLEYSADLYMALNFTAWESDDPKSQLYSREMLMQQQPRAMTVKILKKRMGEAYNKIDFIYRPHINHFEELSGNIRNISADELKPETVEKGRKLERDILRLIDYQRKLENNEIDRFITEDHKRFTKENAGRLSEVIKQKREELSKLQSNAPEEPTETERKVKSERI